MLTLNSSLLNLLAAFCQNLGTELHFVDVLQQIHLIFRGIFLVKYKLKVNGVICVTNWNQKRIQIIWKWLMNHFLNLLRKRFHHTDFVTGSRWSHKFVDQQKAAWVVLHHWQRTFWPSKYRSNFANVAAMRSLKE